MDYNEIYWIYIVESLGYGNHKVKEILDYYGNAKNFYDDKKSSWKYCSFLNSKNIESLKNNDISNAYKIVNRCKELGYELLTIENPKYPQKLKNIVNPPGILYIKGQLPQIDDNLSISIVGTRSSIPYGNKVAFEMGYNLAKVGAIVVSGAALGIDGLSQKGALQAKGKTIAVLGCGLNHKYLMRNKSLRDNISKQGALISEYVPDYHCAPWTFPMRNRIISGLSDGTLVVEAGETSGSLITANLALEQNRDVFAVPGDINSCVSYGTNKLIKICAKPVTCVQDILEEYYNRYPLLEKREQENINKKEKILKENKIKKDLPANLSNKARLLFNNLTSDPLYIDELSSLSKMNTPETLQAITELELYGCIKAHAGKRYSKP